MTSIVKQEWDDLGAVERTYGEEDRARGAVFTKKPVVDLLFTLGNYKQGSNLLSTRILEPSFGHGDFLLPAARKLLTEWKGSAASGKDEVLDSCIRGVEIDEDSYLHVEKKLRALLDEFGVERKAISRIIDSWIHLGDFLLTDFDQTFDLVIGNPPYVRPEAVDSELLAIYKSNFPTMIGRADLYVAFFEHSLRLLSDNGRVAFICSDSWIKNAYGKALRSSVVKKYWLRYYVDLYGLDVFDFQVGTYPSITVIEKKSEKRPTRIVKALSANVESLAKLGEELIGDKTEHASFDETSLDDSEGAPWLFSKRDGVELIRELESRFPTLEAAGCSVGIGVATGLDRVFIGDYDRLDVEETRKLRLATNRDVIDGRLSWSGKGVINPYSDDGALVNLDEFPKLASYLRAHEDALKNRHTAKKSPAGDWYRTIDKIRPMLTHTPKLFVPDIRGNGSAIAFDEGTLYPHHNLYFITSAFWDLQALRALLLSGIAELFVGAYSVRIGGGYFRFQAQYLRRIRVPSWDSLTLEQRSELTEAGRENRKLSTEFLAEVYGLAEARLSESLGGGAG